MNWAHLHLMVNHLPVIGILFGLLLALYAFVRKNDEVNRLALIFLVLVALAALPAYFTGGAAEDMVERLPGVNKNHVEQHEEMASVALTTLLLMGAVAAAGLFTFRGTKSIPRWFMLVALILSLSGAGVAGLTANLGGQIRHQEARPDFQIPAPSRDERQK
ncbi:MAG: hypothetical protein A2X56_10330 [Nitrospirae bacterium GWC2_57_13]|jgi:uncharacterized membrane protein|nr:MAG: hypothetical protein A2X56_10330 [Nitrospirae bacterium GWC2_57_13]OGW46182.1 MAG: hypothetical protein A2X57_04690 [Nitrospirae bacterium GWD2_57_8]HAR46268.1 hypothetical protein [Nitrospiraceae bacterium]HAS55215.1 hypothetical protein [Nitrospiraceae bacterium]